MFKIDFSKKIPMNMYKERVKDIHQKMHEMAGRDDAFLGWINYTQQESGIIEQTISLGESLKDIDVLVVIGIGGSFLGSSAAYEMFRDRIEENGCELLFLGYDLSGLHMKKALSYLKDKDFYVNVVSKSGGTLETGIAFRLIRQLMEEKYGTSYRNRLIITTDPDKGILKEYADKHNLSTLPIPGNIGGRFSVFTPVGILPLAAAGIDVRAMIAGVNRGKEAYDQPTLEENKAYQYAVFRRMMDNEGKKVELFTAYDTTFSSYLEWLKQLFGESEGKEGKGLYPLDIINTRDLHSMGQLIQEGTKEHFETIIWGQENQEIIVKKYEDDFDGLNYLEGISLDDINEKALEGTRIAHYKGGVESTLIEGAEISPEYFGYLSYFFMKACAMTCYLLGVDPFNQPGVEAYKKEVKKQLVEETNGI